MEDKNNKTGGYDELLTSILAEADSASASPDGNDSPSLTDRQTEKGIVPDRQRRTNDAKVPMLSKEPIDLSVESEKGLPSPARRRIALRSPLPYYAGVYILFLALLSALVVYGVTAYIGVCRNASPDRVAEMSLKVLTESKLRRDIYELISKNEGEYEDATSATEGFIRNMVKGSKVRPFELSRTENAILYDVYVGELPLYSLTLLRNGTIKPLGIPLWTVGELKLIEESVAEKSRSYKITAPKDAEVYIGGVRLTEDYITNRNYHFFIGSVWETTIPEAARCVEYTVDGLYNRPLVEAYISGEKLELIESESSLTVSAKYPPSWVNDYRISVPAGASLYINGVLATTVAESGSAPDTAFDKGEHGSTDIYLIEGLFNRPQIRVTYKNQSLTSFTEDGNTYSYSYPEELMMHATVCVPAGAEVRVNGVLLTSENSSLTDTPFELWTEFPTAIGAFMPRELKSVTNVTLPVFELYTVGGLYRSPEIKVTLDGKECPFVGDEKDPVTGEERSAFDYPTSSRDSRAEQFAADFAHVYLKYVTEGCFGVRDDVELRKNFYENWVDFLSYLREGSLCYSEGLDSYGTVEYLPTLKVISENLGADGVVRYSDDITLVRLHLSYTLAGETTPHVVSLSVLVIREGNSIKVWSHSDIGI